MFSVCMHHRQVNELQQRLLILGTGQQTLHFTAHQIRQQQVLHKHTYRERQTLNKNVTAYCVIFYSTTVFIQKKKNKNSWNRMSRNDWQKINVLCNCTKDNNTNKIWQCLWCYVIVTVQQVHVTNVGKHQQAANRQSQPLWPQVCL